MTPEEFRAAAHELVDWIADFRARVETLPVRATTKPGEIRKALPSAPPMEGESFDAIMEDLDQVIVPGLTHFQHPRFFGYFPSNGLLASVLGDFASTGLGALGLSWQSSPALTEVEEVATDWLRQMVGLSPNWRGVIQDTASTSTLISLLCARERASKFSRGRGGLQGEDKPLVVYVSAQSHSSVEKAALLAGFGKQNIRAVETDAAFAMNADALDAAIERDINEGRVPAAIVATVGTTTSTALDPIARVVEVAKKYSRSFGLRPQDDKRGPRDDHARPRDDSVWLHVDAAMAGSAMILPECRWMWDGIEGADSIVINPHKWLGAAMDCSVYYVRDAKHLQNVMSTNPSYLQSAADGSVTNYRDWGIPLGRRFRALKLWMLIREQGVSALQARIRRDMENATWFAETVRSAKNWKVLAPVPLQTVCIRHEPPGVSGEKLDAHTQAWAERLNASGVAYVTPAVLDGRWMVRVSIGSEKTERRHVEQLWTAIQSAVETV